VQPERISRAPIAGLSTLPRGASLRERGRPARIEERKSGRDARAPGREGRVGEGGAFRGGAAAGMIQQTTNWEEVHVPFAANARSVPLVGATLNS
jgi:hypothetical protein